MTITNKYKRKSGSDHSIRAVIVASNNNFSFNIIRFSNLGIEMHINPMQLEGIRISTDQNDLIE